MALIECPECNQQISLSAYFCPKCGHPKKNIRLEKSERLWQLGAMLWGLFSGFMYYFNINNRGDGIYTNLMYLGIAMSLSFLAIGWINSSYELKSD